MMRQIAAILPFAQLAVIAVIWALVFLARIGSGRTKLILIAIGLGIIIAMFGAELILGRLI